MHEYYTFWILTLKIIALILLLICNVSLAETITEKFKRQLSDNKSGDRSIFASLQTEALRNFNRLTSKCGTKAEYLDLMMFGELIRGVSPLQYYSELATVAFMTCPTGLLQVLDDVDKTLGKSFISKLGIVIPPWELAESIYPAVIKPEYNQVYELYFENWLPGCVDSHGKAIVMCDYES